MEQADKIKLLALFFSKQRYEGHEFLDKLFELDDMWKEEYEKNKRHSFEYGQLKANEAVINYVLNNPNE